MLSNDYILSAMIDNLKNENAIFIYTSDHGESLGENGVYLHGQYPEDKNVKAQFHVPLFFWVSDKFKQNFSHKFINLLNNKSKSLRHENIFHSILDCADINSPIINKNLSLCRFLN